MRRLLPAVVAAGLIAPTAADAHDTGLGLQERVAMKQCSQSRVIPCIRRAAIHWRVDVHMLVRKARCESRLQPGAYNPSGASGLFQFLPSTWATTPYGSRPIMSAKYSALAAAWMHARGRGNEWVCR